MFAVAVQWSVHMIIIMYFSAWCKLFLIIPVEAIVYVSLLTERNPGASNVLNVVWKHCHGYNMFTKLAWKLPAASVIDGIVWCKLDALDLDDDLQTLFAECILEINVVRFEIRDYYLANVVAAIPLWPLADNVYNCFLLFLPVFQSS